VRRLAIVLAAAAATLVPTAATAGPGSPAEAGVQLTPILRVPFPNRGYVLDLSKPANLTSSDVQLTENGVRIDDVSVSPLSESGLRFGVVLAVDSSLTMAGTPYASALAAARSFIAHRGPNEQIGIVTFNTRIGVLSPLTPSAKALNRALDHAPAVAYGTHVYDAVDVALSLLRRAKLSTGSIVLLTDGQNVGSRATLSGAVTRAYRQHVRVFTVGLRSPAFDPAPLRSIAGGTGGSYAEATSPKALAPIYLSLSNRLAREYVLQYRSLTPPNTLVNLRVSIAGLGSSTSSYTSPKPSGLAPFHRSFFTRFLLSVDSLLVLALLVAGLAIYVVRRLLPGTGSSMVERIAAFATPSAPPRPTRDWRARSREVVATSRKARGALAGLDRTLEIADIRMSAAALVGLTVAATVIALIVLAAISPVIAILGVATPLISRALVRRKLKRVRDQFSEQLPPNLQVLASALRAGHSFVAALASVVEQADEPSRRELRRVVSDEQLGVPVDEAIRRVAERMKSRDLDQVALVAELQRTTGGNVAEVLDVVVATIRDRQDVRRMVKTLTAQGRMARWILSGLPVVTGLAFYAIQPNLAGPFYSATIGKVAFLIAAVAVISGSLIIQRFIEIEV
jgi:tight adherence protein B